MTEYQFYNVQVSRSGARVRMEIRELLKRKPLILGLSETMGYDLATHPGYEIVRDRSKPSRGNITAYVANGHLQSVKWFDMKETWKRTEGPGEHEPRSWLEVRLDGDQVLVGHQPPKGTNNTIPAQQEGISFLTARMAPWSRGDWAARTEAAKDRARGRRRIVLADFNRRVSEAGPGPATLASLIRGSTTGARIDAAVERGFDVLAHRYIEKVNNVILKSDHKAALIITTKEY